ncbi:MAG: outer membrane beta-barrel protein [Melioribacteraceae bacterium]|jgi:outer membrane protein W|nr:outer membrane beta-barrel protein [Melioribacteraceae bacterium]
MQNAKLLVFILILFFTLSVSSFAQAEKEQKNDLSGKYALQFQIDHYFTLSNFQGGTISGKYHCNNNSALRFGVTLGYEARDIELGSTDVRSDTTIIEDFNGEISSSTIQLSIQYLYYFEINNSIAPFLGVGVNYLMQPDTEDIIDYRISKYEQSGYGIDFLIGVEWFVRTNIGIHAEYGAGFGYNSYEYSSERPSYYVENEMNKNYDKSSGFELSSNYVKFGVSIYF